MLKISRVAEWLVDYSDQPFSLRVSIVKAQQHKHSIISLQLTMKKESTLNRVLPERKKIITMGSRRTLHLLHSHVRVIWRHTVCGLRWPRRSAVHHVRRWRHVVRHHATTRGNRWCETVRRRPHRRRIRVRHIAGLAARPKGGVGGSGGGGGSGMIRGDAHAGGRTIGIRDT